MTFTIDGVDLSPYLKDNNLSRGYTERKAKSRIAVDGTLYITKVRKLTLAVDFDPMPESTLQSVITAINKDYVTLVYTDPVDGLRTRVFIPSVGDITLALENVNNTNYWSGLSLSLEEQ